MALSLKARPRAEIIDVEPIRDETAIAPIPPKSTKRARKPKSALTAKKKQNQASSDPPTRAGKIAANKFFEKIGHNRMVEALEHTDQKKAIQLVELLLDPANKQTSFATLYRRVGLTMADIVGWVTDYSRDISLLALNEQMPEVMADVVYDARNRTVPCLRCDETGSVTVLDEQLIPDSDPPKYHEVEVRKRCPACFGARVVVQSGANNARELVFEASGFTGKKVPLIAQQFNLGVVRPMEDDASDVQRLIDAQRGEG